MLETSKDLLILTSSFAVGILTILLACIFYFVASLLKQVRDLVKDAKEKVEKVWKTVDTVRDKIEHAASFMTLVAEGIKQLLEYLREKRKKGK